MKLGYEPLKVPLFHQCVNLTGGCVTKERYVMTIMDLNKIGYRNESFILAKDVTKIFYVKNMSSEHKKGAIKSKDKPKRNIVFLGKKSLG